ncbi:MAG: N-acetyltransferase [Proteobacteria bacterium]|nr:N-acetyltransferase [Pseudomonadota bacterium]
MATADEKFHIRMAEAADLAAVQAIHRAAFGSDIEPDLVAEILADPTARPVLSLLAASDAQPVGHILFSAVHLRELEGGCVMAILAPLAVRPEFQRRGVGGMLIEAGLQHLSDIGVDLVFVLGDPKYYGRHTRSPRNMQTPGWFRPSSLMFWARFRERSFAATC